jgi:hypothetical protein
MQETLRVKDDEICQLSRDLKARDLTIKELAGQLSQTAQAAESAASTVYVVENQHKAALTEVDHLCNELLRVVQKVCWLIVLHSALGCLSVAIHLYIEALSLSTVCWSCISAKVAHPNFCR